MRRIVAFRNEDGRRLRRVPRRVVEEAHAVVDRQPLAGLPRVLQVELGDGALALHLRERVDLGVVAEVAEQRVGVGVVRVERIVDVGAEVELAGPRTRADAAAAFRIARLLEVEAALDRVLPRDPGQVGANRGQPRFALIDQPVVEREVRRVGHVERHFRNDVARVQLGMELADGEADRVAVDAGPVVLGQRIELLGLLTGPEVGIEDQVRPRILV